MRSLEWEGLQNIGEKASQVWRSSLTIFTLQRLKKISLYFFGSVGSRLQHTDLCCAIFPHGTQVLGLSCSAACGISVS